MAWRCNRLCVSNRIRQPFQVWIIFQLLRIDWQTRKLN
jgi:hypothetical protein